MKLEVDPKSVNGDKYRVAVAVAGIVRPFILNGSKELIPTNITIKEVARRARMDPYTVGTIIGEPQQLREGLTARDCIAFSDLSSHTWNITTHDKYYATRRAKKAARMAGLRGATEGGLAATRTFASMEARFRFQAKPIHLESGPPPEIKLKVTVERPTSQRWTHRSKAKIQESDNIVYEVVKKSGYFSRDLVQLEAEHRAALDKF